MLLIVMALNRTIRYDTIQFSKRAIRYDTIIFSKGARQYDTIRFNIGNGHTIRYDTISFSKTARRYDTIQFPEASRRYDTIRLMSQTIRYDTIILLVDDTIRFNFCRVAGSASRHTFRALPASCPAFPRQAVWKQLQWRLEAMSLFPVAIRYDTIFS